MTRITRRQPQLSESWADMDDSQTSEEEFQPRLREAYYNSHKSGILSESHRLSGKSITETASFYPSQTECFTDKQQSVRVRHAYA
jgi:hypothetical protein